MAKRAKVSVGDILKDIKKEMTNSIESELLEIPDIITFIEDEQYLNIKTLTPVQELTFKVFYRGSMGNENLELTDRDIEIIKKHKLEDDPEHVDRGNLLDKWNNGSLFRELVLVWGRRCLSADTGVIDSKTGEVCKIKDVDKYFSSYTYNEKDNCMESISGVDLIPQGKRQCYKLTTMFGHQVEATDNHPFLTQKGWVELKDLDIENDKIAICESLPFFGNSTAINKNEAALLGYMTADGCCSSTNIFFTCANDAILQDFTNKLNLVSGNLKIFNDPWTKAKSKDFQYKITSKNIRYESFFDVKKKKQITRRKKNDLSNLLEKWNLLGKTCHKKTVPDELLSCPKEVIASYLRALFSCDATLCRKTREKYNDHVQFQFTTVNKIQAEKVQALLLKFGILAKLRTKKVKSSIIDEKNIKKTYNTECYLVEFMRKKYIKIFLEEIGLVGKDNYIEAAQDILYNIVDKKSNHKDNTPYSLLKIRSIEKTEVKETFDLSVSHENYKQNFILDNGIISHNSGKDFFTGILAAYEAMRLIEGTDGDPYEYYGISDAAPISILTIAGSGDQATTAFNEIHNKIMGSKYFFDKIGPDSLQAKSISLLTKRDKKLNQERKDAGINYENKGSIVVEVGHSNSDTLRGKQIYTCIMDEIAFYKNTGGSSSGDVIYQSLLPAVATFNVDTDVPMLNSSGEQEVDFNDNPEWVKRYDGKMVFISSPAGQEGIFWKLYENSPFVKQRLMLRLPTWEVQPKYRREDLRRDAAEMSEEQFLMEFGAEFSGTAGLAFFDKGLTKNCYQQGGHLTPFGKPGHLYFAHLDPARTSHNYALAVVHRENFRKEDGSRDFRVVVDDLRYWHPTPGNPINIEAVDEYILLLKRKFRLKMVTYDHWPIDQTVQKMKKAGIPHKMTQFTPKFKVLIYDELLNLVNGGKLIIPPSGSMAWHSPASELLHREMDNLQKKVTYNAYRVMCNKDADCNTDDLCVDPNTLVFTKNGPKYINDLIINQEILTHNGNWCKVQNISNHVNNLDSVSIKPYYGFELKCTNNHPIEVLGDDGFIWKDAGKLVISDWILKSFPNGRNELVYDLLSYVNMNNVHKNHKVNYIKDKKVRIPNPNAKWHDRFVKTDLDFGYICGQYLSEGNISDHGVSFAGNITHKHIYDKLNNSFIKVFGFKISKPYLGEGLACQSTCNSKIVKEMFIQLFGNNKAGDKYIPVDMLNANDSFCTGLLRGYFDGDGSSSDKCITLTTTSKKMAHNIQQMLLKYEIISSISISKRAGKSTKINDRKVNYNYDLYNVRVCEFESFNKLNKLIDIDLFDKVESKYHKKKYKFFDGKVACKVRNIEDIELLMVTNLSVNGDNSFVAESCNTHNCDALAGACYSCVTSLTKALPTSRCVDTGMGGTSNQQIWRGPSGVIGQGTGQQVSNNLEQRGSWPNKFR